MVVRREDLGSVRELSALSFEHICDLSTEVGTIKNLDDQSRSRKARLPLYTKKASKEAPEEANLRVMRSAALAPGKSFKAGQVSQLVPVKSRGEQSKQLAADVCRVCKPQQFDYFERRISTAKLLKSVLSEGYFYQPILYALPGGTPVDHRFGCLSELGRPPLFEKSDELAC